MVHILVSSIALPKGNAIGYLDMVVEEVRIRDVRQERPEKDSRQQADKGMPAKR